MSHNSENEKLLTQYLLGELSKDDRKQLEKRFFADEDLLEELHAVESDLIDSYVRGELMDERLVRFERRFLVSAETRRQVLFADALTKALLRHRDKNQPVVPIVPKPVATASRPGQIFRAHKLRPALVAMTIAAVAICAFMILKWARESPPSDTVAVTGPGPDEPVSGSTPSPSPPEVASTPVQSTGPKLATFVLTPLTRGDQRQRLMIAPTVNTVRIVLQFRSGDYERYLAALQRLDAKKDVQVWGLLKSQRSQGSNRVIVQIPASALSSGEYVIVLSGKNDVGGLDLLSKYPFEVVKK